ncbi:MAG: flagellar hook-associated protein FlgK [Phycisphaeraceae bacterium]|nr:flagellar hook-associated protein FlgK [Phycisphaeraceae bacterium]
MSLNGAFQIGRTGLTASQLAIQVTGNNLSNAATPGYTRQSATMIPAFDSRNGSVFLGRGVEVAAVRRQIDSALQQRLWSGLSAESGAQSDLATLSGVETTLDALSGTSLSNRLSAFFNAWSELANTPQQAGTRSLVVQQGQQLAQYMQSLRGSLTQQRIQIDRDLEANATRTDALLSQIAGLNRAIVTSENGLGTANGLRDQRDALLTELSQYMDVTTVEQPSGAIDVLVGSSPVVLSGTSRGVRLKQEAVNGEVRVSISTVDNNERLDIRAGRLGSLLGQRETAVNDTIARLDTMAAQLVFRVNRLHSQGLGSAPLTSVVGQTQIRSGDEALSFNDPANQSFASLPFAAQSGSFRVTIRNSATGASESLQVNVDLDGITSTGTPGFADDTTPDALRAAIDGMANVSASFTADGRLSISAAPGYEVQFSEDTSGVLAVMGVNTYFTGTSARDIAVRAELLGQPGLLSAARMTGLDKSDNGTALAVAALRDEAIGSLGGGTLLGHWDQTVQSVAVRTSAARTGAESTAAVRQSLEAQRSAVSGVSVDEEAINLLTYQRQYQASARYISVLDEMTKTLLSLV